nr:MAG TPA: hypothetical protein [Bacteriophage sp.]
MQNYIDSFSTNKNINLTYKAQNVIVKTSYI